MTRKIKFSPGTKMMISNKHQQKHIKGEQIIKFELTCYKMYSAVYLHQKADANVAGLRFTKPLRPSFNVFGTRYIKSTVIPDSVYPFFQSFIQSIFAIELPVARFQLFKFASFCKVL